MFLEILLEVVAKIVRLWVIEAMHHRVYACKYGYQSWIEVLS